MTADAAMHVWAEVVPGFTEVGQQGYIENDLMSIGVGTTIHFSRAIRIWQRGDPPTVVVCRSNTGDAKHTSVVRGPQGYSTKTFRY